MPKRKKALVDEPLLPTPPPAVVTAPYNPLRDRALLTTAVQRLASSVVEEKRTLTAMSFCVEVLQSLGLSEIAIGQAERIFISGARKTALGGRDADHIAKPEPARPVVVPHLDIVAAALQSHAGSFHPPDYRARLSQACDADELRSASLVHLAGFLRPAEAEAVAQSLAGGVTTSVTATPPYPSRRSPCPAVRCRRLHR